MVLFKSLSRIRSIFLFASLLLPGLAQAHIKWFAPYDVSAAPQAMTAVLNFSFITVLIVFSLAVFVFFLVDSYVLQQGMLQELERRALACKPYFLPLLRACTAVFFIGLGLFSLYTDTAVWLTPELHTASKVIPWLQLMIGLCALSQRSTPLLGYGILGLLIAAVHSFGLYHMLDYLLFAGLAYFFLVCNLQSSGWRRSGFFVLYVSSGLTFLWAAIEKFGYPQWTYPMLTANPELLLGMSQQSFMILAGFIEFTIAFLVLAASSALQRLLALLLPALMLAGIIKFGLVDAIGHFMIIAVFLLWFVLGPQVSHRRLHWLRASLQRGKQGIWQQATRMTGLYFVALIASFASYYGLHYQFYGA